TVWVDIDEMQVHGYAQVSAVEPCPAIGDGPGYVVRSTFVRVANDLVELELDGAAEPLEMTAGHRIFSLDRHSWVPAIDLRCGERVSCVRGGAKVCSVRRLPGAQRVYNLEVAGVHRYFVGSLGVLVHNSVPCEGRYPNLNDGEHVGEGKKFTR